VGRKTIVIIISLVSAFMLMSAGYGFWSKPLIITGEIKVIKRPQQAVGIVASLSPVVLDLNQVDIVNPDGTINPGSTVNLDNTVNPEVPDILEGNTDVEPTDPAPVDQSAETTTNPDPVNDLETEDSLDAANQGQEPTGSETPTPSTSVEADEPKEDQSSETESIQQDNDVTIDSGNDQNEQVTSPDGSDSNTASDN